MTAPARPKKTIDRIRNLSLSQTVTAAGMAVSKQVTRKISSVGRIIKKTETKVVNARARTENGWLSDTFAA